MRVQVWPQRGSGRSPLCFFTNPHASSSPRSAAIGEPSSLSLLSSSRSSKSSWSLSLTAASWAAPLSCSLPRPRLRDSTPPPPPPPLPSGDTSRGASFPSARWPATPEPLSSSVGEKGDDAAPPPAVSTRVTSSRKDEDVTLLILSFIRFPSITSSTSIPSPASPAMSTPQKVIIGGDLTAISKFECV